MTRYPEVKWLWDWLEHREPSMVEALRDCTIRLTCLAVAVRSVDPSLSMELARLVKITDTLVQCYENLDELLDQVPQ